MAQSNPPLVPITADAAGDVERGIAALRPAIVAYVASILPHARHETEDVVQKTCVLLWERRNDFEAGTNFKAWAFKTAYFQVLAQRRDLVRNKETVFSDQMLQRLAGPAEEAASRIDHRIEGLRQCMAGLTPSERQLLDLKYVQHVPLADHARSVGVPPGRLQRAISRLRFVLKHCIEKHLNSP